MVVGGSVETGPRPERSFLDPEPTLLELDERMLPVQYWVCPNSEGSRLGKAGFKVNPRKAQVGQTTVRYLGHNIGQGSKILHTDRKTALADMPRPTTVPGTRRVIGLFNYCRNLVPQLANLAEPIQRLVIGGKPGSEAVGWGPEQEIAYD